MIIILPTRCDLLLWPLIKECTKVAAPNNKRGTIDCFMLECVVISQKSWCGYLIIYRTSIYAYPSSFYYSLTICEYLTAIHFCSCRHIAIRSLLYCLEWNNETFLLCMASSLYCLYLHAYVRTHWRIDSMSIVLLHTGVNNKCPLSLTLFKTSPLMTLYTHVAVIYCAVDLF